MNTRGDRVKNVFLRRKDSTRIGIASIRNAGWFPEELRTTEGTEGTKKAVSRGFGSTGGPEETPSISE
jgi:hypothetical protein